MSMTVLFRVKRRSTSTCLCFQGNTCLGFRHLTKVFTRHTTPDHLPLSVSKHLSSCEGKHLPPCFLIIKGWRPPAAPLVLTKTDAESGKWVSGWTAASPF